MARKVAYMLFSLRSSSSTDYASFDLDHREEFSRKETHRPALDLSSKDHLSKFLHNLQHLWILLAYEAADVSASRHVLFKATSLSILADRINCLEPAVA